MPVRTSCFPSWNYTADDERVQAVHDFNNGLKPYYYHSGLPSTIRYRSIFHDHDPVIEPDQLDRALAYIEAYSAEAKRASPS